MERFERFVFGSYPMGDSRENIPWLVLEKKENRVKLISEHVLDWRPFNHTLKKIAVGRWFIRTYYRLSPPLADKLRNAGRINHLVRKALDCWVRGWRKGAEQLREG